MTRRLTASIGLGALAVTGEGEHTIQYRSNDANHNTERTQSVTFVTE